MVESLPLNMGLNPVWGIKIHTPMGNERKSTCCNGDPGPPKKKKRKFSERELFLSTPQGTVGSTPRGNASHTLNPEGAQHILPSVFTSVWSLPRQCLPGLNQTLEAKCVSFKCPSSGMETYPRTQRIHCQK